jgi:hypothetical protein
MQKPNGWARLLEQSGEEETAETLKACVIAETHLLAAITAVDIDWCIRRLRNVRQKLKAGEPAPELIIDIILRAGRKQVAP